MIQKYYHALDPQMRREGYQIYQPITVGNNVWFGAGVTVLPGVPIGDHVIIGAGSVVIGDIPAGVLAAGNPCKVIRLFQEKDKEKYPIPSWALTCRKNSFFST